MSNPLNRNQASAKQVSILAGGAVFTVAAAILAYNKYKPTAPSNLYTAKSTFLVNASPEQAYTLWHDFANLPRFMSHLESVRVLDGKISEWTAIGPLGSQATWKAEITADLPGARIAWSSLPDSDITNVGSVEFRPDPQGRGTFVTSTVRYSLPGGAAAKALITLLGKNPQFVVKEDLRRFKSLLEANEAPTVKGQSHGPRSLTTKISKALFREETNQPEPQAATASTKSPIVQSRAA